MKIPRGSIDIVMIINSDGIGVQYFPITKLKEAETKAKEMAKYHHDVYEVIIKNVPKALYPDLCGRNAN